MSSWLKLKNKLPSSTLSLINVKFKFNFNCNLNKIFELCFQTTFRQNNNKAILILEANNSSIVKGFIWFKFYYSIFKFFKLFCNIIII